MLAGVARAAHRLPTPLLARREASIEALLSHGADLGSVDIDGLTPFKHALVNGRTAAATATAAARSCDLRICWSDSSSVDRVSSTRRMACAHAFSRFAISMKLKSCEAGRARVSAVIALDP